MPCNFLVEFREIGTYSRTHGGCHLSTLRVRALHAWPMLARLAGRRRSREEELTGAQVARGSDWLGVWGSYELGWPLSRRSGLGLVQRGSEWVEEHYRQWDLAEKGRPEEGGKEERRDSGREKKSKMDF